MDIKHVHSAERWRAFSIAEQMGNIGSEVSRAARAQGKDQERFKSAVERALELFDLTLDDPRWRPPRWPAGGRLTEIARAREVFCDAVEGGRRYGNSLESLIGYFDEFALAARSELNPKP